MFPKEHLQYMSFKNITLTFNKSSNSIQYDVMCQSTLTSPKIILKKTCFLWGTGDYSKIVLKHEYITYMK